MLDFAVNVRAAEPPSWLVDRLADRLAGRALRAAMVAGLTSIGLDVTNGCAPFVPVDVIADSLR
jgi:hypothetical protein